MADRELRLKVAIAGGHGKVARRLGRLLVKRGDKVVGLIRKPEHAKDLYNDGVTPVECDVETASIHELAGAIAGADVVVFAAGAGPGSGPARKLTIDRDGAIKLVEAARLAEIDRYVMISSLGAENPPDGDDTFSVYLRAKAEADRVLMASDRRWAIVRPVFMNDDPGTGRVTISREPLEGEVTRDDVAAVLAFVVHDPRTTKRILYVSSGDDPVAEAIEKAVND
jgi:uncharacterized protein YbjT (DUF2867 family)